MISSTPRHCWKSPGSATQSSVTRPPVCWARRVAKRKRHPAFGRLVDDDEELARLAELAARHLGCAGGWRGLRAAHFRRCCHWRAAGGKGTLIAANPASLSVHRADSSASLGESASGETSRRSRFDRAFPWLISCRRAGPGTAADRRSGRAACGLRGPLPARAAPLRRGR